MPQIRDVASATIRHRSRADGAVAFDVRYRLDGKSRTLSFQTDESAKRWAMIVRCIGPAEALKIIRKQDSGDVATLDEWAEEYIVNRSGLEASTHEDYRSYMRLSISPTLSALPLDAISPARIAAWVKDQSEQGYAGKTISNRRDSCTPASRPPLRTVSLIGTRAAASDSPAPKPARRSSSPSPSTSSELTS